MPALVVNGDKISFVCAIMELSGSLVMLGILIQSHITSMYQLLCDCSNINQLLILCLYLLLLLLAWKYPLQRNEWRWIQQRKGRRRANLSCMFHSYSPSPQTGSSQYRCKHLSLLMYFLVLSKTYDIVFFLLGFNRPFSFSFYIYEDSDYKIDDIGMG